MSTNKTKKLRSAYSSYGYQNVNGQDYYGRYEYNSGSNSYEFVAYGRYIAVKNIYSSIDKANSPTIVTIEYDNLAGQRKQIDVDRSLWAKPSELQSLLLGLGADASANMSILIKCLSVSEKSVCTIKHMHHKTGWVIKNALSDVELLYKGRRLLGRTKSASNSVYVGPYDLGQKGAFADWRQMVLEYVIGNTPLEVALLIGLSPIISGLCGTRNLIYHFMGDSSKGKTTSANLVVSVAGCPNPVETATRQNLMGETLRPLLSSWNGTSNALLKKLQGLDSTIMVFDELSKLLDTKALPNILYSIADGADKDRMNGLSSMQAVDTFKTNILSIGEESLLDKAGSGNTGLRMRVCEIQADFTRDADQAMAITAGCYENYGFAASRLAAYIVRKMDYEKVKALYNQHLSDYEAALIATGIQTNSTRRLAEFGAILLATAEIAEKALSISFSDDEIRDFMLNQQTSTGQNLSIGQRAHTALWSYINQNIAHFIVGPPTTWNKNIPCYGRIVANKNGTGKEVNFDKGCFRTIMASLGFNNTGLILQNFKSMGLLNHETNKLDRKRTINAQLGQTRVYSIIFP